MKLGVSFQYPETLTPEHLVYLKQMGVEAIELRMMAPDYSLESLLEIKQRVTSAGLEIHELMLQDKYSPHTVTLGREGRDEDIALLQSFVRDLGRAGIHYTTYAWHTGGAGQTGRADTRGATARYFHQEAAESQPLAYDRAYDDDEMWDNYFYFMERMLPVCEEADVRLQLHPNDPPVTHQGIARIFRDTASYRRAFEAFDHNPYSTALFCVGTWSEMSGPDGTGEDIEAAIREFGPRGQISQVHLRNITSPMPNFQETFPDDGYLNLFSIVCALREVGFTGMITPDHVPDCGDGMRTESKGHTYALGYIRGLIQASASVVGP